MNKVRTSFAWRSFRSNVIRRKYSQYNYNFHQFQSPTKSWPKRLFYGTVGIVAVTSIAYYLWWPKHTFPSPVARILRKGLWAESDRGEMDYQLALKYYLEAIQKCEEIGLDNLTDEYTGIQLKAAEMFERLGQIENAAFIYNEIATLYLKVLTAPPNSPDGKRIKSRSQRQHLIQKDLRIAIKLVELNKTNPQLSKAILMTHLLIAQDEVLKRLGHGENITELTSNLANSNSEYHAKVDNRSIEIISDGETKVISKNPDAWEPFADEFFTVMDLLSTVCVSTGDLAMASKIRISMTEWMLVADADPERILFSQCNLASLLYLQAEEYESREIAYKRNFFEEAGFDFNKVRTLSKEDIEKGNYLKKVDEVVSQDDRKTYELIIDDKNKCITLSIKSYESVLEFAKNLPNEITSNNTKISEAVALATYGLGVVNLHLGKYDKAERLLREARVRSKACEYRDLIEEVERELSKLFSERQSKLNDNLHEGDIQVDIHLKDA